jgi:hypothetical protein
MANALETKLSNAKDVARKFLVEEITEQRVGEHLGFVVEGENVATHKFKCVDIHHIDLTTIVYHNVAQAVVNGHGLGKVTQRQSVRLVKYIVGYFLAFCRGYNGGSQGDDIGVYFELLPQDIICRRYL